MGLGPSQKISRWSARLVEKIEDTKIRARGSRGQISDEGLMFTTFNGATTNKNKDGLEYGIKKGWKK